MIHDPAPVIGVPQPVQREEYVQSGEDCIPHLYQLTVACQSDRLKSNVVLASLDGGEHISSAGGQRAPVQVEDDETRYEAEGEVIGKYPDPSGMVVIQANEAHQADDHSNGAKQCNSWSGIIAKAPDQGTCVLREDANCCTCGDQKAESREDSHASADSENATTAIAKRFLMVLRHRVGRVRFSKGRACLTPRRTSE